MSYFNVNSRKNQNEQPRNKPFRERDLQSTTASMYVMLKSNEARTFYT